MSGVAVAEEDSSLKAARVSPHWVGCSSPGGGTLPGSAETPRSLHRTRLGRVSRRQAFENAFVLSKLSFPSGSPERTPAKSTNAEKRSVGQGS